MDDMIYEDGVLVSFYQAEKLMVKIKAPNSIDVLEKKASEQDIARFPNAYAEFNDGEAEAEAEEEVKQDDGLVEKAAKFFKKKSKK